MPDPSFPGTACVRDSRPVEGGVDLDLWLPADHPCFRGHFPAVPILAGAVQIDWAVQLADAYLKTGIGAACRFQVKFRRPIRPVRTVTLALRLHPEKQALTFDYRDDGEIYSTGRIALRDAR
jgi:3-hydroxymyristoyl/3-hydroxydecanoyl-(acyl carrier protein) dehydratase